MIDAVVETNPADFADYSALHTLLTEAFAYMEGRIDPPSSLARMGLSELRDKLRAEDLFLIRKNALPIACLFGAVLTDSYYIGKLAVAHSHRKLGLARALMAAAQAQARIHGCRALELQTRVELTENHATFARLGFVQTAATAHPGYDRPTSLTFRRDL